MKARTYFRIMLMLMALVGMTACENEDNPVDNPESKVQTDYYYYGHYDSDEKVYLTLNENNFAIYVPKEYAEISERILSNIRILETIGGDFDGFIVTRADYKRLTALNFWKEDSKSVIVTASYFYENTTRVVFLSPYLYVKLKKEEDIDLLSSYAEKYRLEIVEQNSFMPLWYTLKVTSESEISPLDCANELYESGNFAASAPDLVSAPFINTSGDIEEHEVSPEEIPEGALNQTTTEFSGPEWNGVHKNINFDDTPVEERPKTAAEFFNTFIGEGIADCFKCTQHYENSERDGWGDEYYQQYYKDVIVKIDKSYFAYVDGAISWAVCYYLPIKDFDVTPQFDKWVAYEIFKSFMKLENYYEDRCELQIVSLPEGDSVGPRLVYEVKKGYEGLVIDARSGRALYRTSYDYW